MICFSHKGDFSKTYYYLERMKETTKRGILDKYGKAGVEALKNATPVDTGVTANSWDYRLEHTPSSDKIIFVNNNIQNGIMVAILLQYGHGTGTGGWVEGVDYINPALKPIFDELTEKVWKEVTR